MSSLAQSAYEKIRQRIVSGEWTTANSFSETSLALELHVSRTPVREAIRRLESEGLLEQRPKQGTYVRAPSRREMRELFELRIFLEPPAAARAAKKGNSALTRQLTELLEEMGQLAQLLAENNPPQEKVGRYRRHMACDRAFHEAIIQESGNRRVCKVVDDAGVLSAGLGCTKDRPPAWLEKVRQADREHAGILLAILQSDARSAYRGMRRHLVLGLRNALDYFDWLNEQEAAAAP